jgi:hypothetical protein
MLGCTNITKNDQYCYWAGKSCVSLPHDAKDYTHTAYIMVNANVCRKTYLFDVPDEGDF